MNEYDFDAVINELYGRVVKAEQLADEAEEASRTEMLAKIEDFTEVFAQHDGLWKRYLEISELDDDLEKRLTELIKLLEKEKKVPIELVENIRELFVLLRRVGVAQATVTGAIRRLMDRENELIEAEKAELLRLQEYEEAFYDMGGEPEEEEEEEEEDEEE